MVRVLRAALGCALAGCIAWGAGCTPEPATPLSPSSQSVTSGEPGTASASPASTSTSADSAVAPEPPVAGDPTSSPEIPTPFAQFMLGPEEEATLNFARELLLDECMKQFGLTSSINSYDSWLALEHQVRISGVAYRFGPTVMDFAAQYGYGPLPSPQLIAVSPQGASNFEVLHGARSLDELASAGMNPESPGDFIGIPIPPGGCIGKAFRDLEDDGGLGWGSIAMGSWAASMGEMFESERYEMLVATWVECLSETGYQVTDPINDAGDIARLRGSRSGSTPSEEEVALALEDVACKDRLGFTEDLTELDAEFAEAGIAQNLQALQDNRSELDSKVELAEGHIERLGGYR